MPNPSPDTSNLTKGKGKALEALGVVALEPGESSFVVRVRGPADLKAKLRAMSPKEIGEALWRGLELVSQPES